MSRNYRHKKESVLRIYHISIARRNPGEMDSWQQTFLYQAATVSDTIATALTEINARPALTDVEGKPASIIRWECSCLQKKCGACAMLINGEPALACDTYLADLPDRILLAPLRKFPVVADLIVDRSIMQQNLRDMQVWLAGDARLSERHCDDVYEASVCLQCGLCLEVCPNFSPEGNFTGAAAAVPAARILTVRSASPNPTAPLTGSKMRGDRRHNQNSPQNELEKQYQNELEKQYEKRFFEGCGKSLACQNICPAGIRTGDLLAQSTAVALWRRTLGRRHK